MIWGQQRSGQRKLIFPVSKACQGLACLSKLYFPVKQQKHCFQRPYEDAVMLKQILCLGIILRSLFGT
jgi:hypothetical protein